MSYTPDVKFSQRLALVFATFGALIAGGLQYRQTRLLRREVNSRVENMAEVTLSAVRALVEAQSRQQNLGELGRNLESLVRQAGVASVVVFDARGRRLVGRADGSPSAARSPHLGLSPDRCSDGFFDVEAPVALGARGTGKVWLSLHTDRFDARLREIKTDGVRTGAMAILSIALVAWLLGVSFAMDIERLLPRVEALPRDPEKFRPVRPLSSVSEITRLAAAFNAMGESLKRENARRRALELEKRELSAMLVHDLKTPLTVINAGIALLREQMAEQGAENGHARTFELLDLSAGRLRRMVEDVLQLSRLEEVEGLRERVAVDLSELARSCAKDFELIAAGRKQKIEILVPEEAAIVLGDAPLLRRVLDNFVYNAVEHNPDGATVRVEVSREEDGRVRASVADEGPGVPAEARAEIFRKFFQSDLKRHVGNVGLGLALCEKVIERHGGAIGISDGKPRGACFYFTLAGARTPARAAEAV